MTNLTHLVNAMAKRPLPDEWEECIQRLECKDEGHGYDLFGLHPNWIRTGVALLRFLYEKWFRVRSEGHMHIPPEKGAILASNHSGTLPFDGMMIYLDLLRHSHPTRLPRAIMDHFVPMLPFIGTFFARVGVVGGSRGNFQTLLEQDELVLVFPEGEPGISKPFSKRYQLQDWRIGHVELSIRHQVPVVPVAVVGAEEQMPKIAEVPISMFGIPSLPIPLTLFPLPVRYHIYYGESIPFYERYRPEDADDPEIVNAAALEVKAQVQDLINKGLQRREGVFR